MSTRKSAMSVALLTLASSSGACTESGGFARHDAATERNDAMQQPQDAMQQLSADGGAPADAQSASAPKACDLSQACSADELCAPDGFCLPACDARGVCVVATSMPSLELVWATGGRLYVRVAAPTDALGNAVGQGELRRLEPAGELTRVASGSDIDSVASDETHLYWHADQKLWRVPLDLSSEPVALYPSPCSFALLQGQRIALFDAVSLVLGSRDGLQPLREVAARGRVECPRIAAHGERVIFTRASTAIAVDVNTDHEQDLGLQHSTDTFAVERDHLYVRDFYFSFEGYRVALTPPFIEQKVTDLSYANAQAQRRVGAAPVPHNGWLYRFSSSSPDESYYLDLERWSLDKLGTVQAIVDPSFRAAREFQLHDPTRTAGFAVSDTHLYAIASLYRGTSRAIGSLLYRFPLPPAP